MHTHHRTASQWLQKIRISSRLHYPNKLNAYHITKETRGAGRNAEKNA